jgi:3-dehydroquinate synthase
MTTTTLKKSFYPSKLHYGVALPSRKAFPQDALLIYDKALEKSNPYFLQWSRAFKNRFALSSGENLKTLKSFESFLVKLHKQKIALHKSSEVLAVGGGSLGDFAGFFASVFQRGLPLVHIPSTYLAAIDSSHGGKSGLNFLKAKNQIGTFYPASRVFISKKLLSSQNNQRLVEASAEMFKMACLDSGAWGKRFLNDLLQTQTLSDELRLQIFYKYLPMAVSSKYRVVAKDPYEATGYRKILNLGHTLGHILEGCFTISHGLAVAFGIEFALKWSYSRGYLSKKECDYLSSALVLVFAQLFESKHRYRLRKKNLRKFFHQDKKSLSSKHVAFVFLKSRAKPCLVSVSFDEFCRELQKQGWKIL